MPMKSKQYLLDTNILIDILNDNPKVMENLAQVGTLKCCMSTISLHELYYGAQLAREKKEEYFIKEMNKISRLLEVIDVHPLASDGIDYAKIKHLLKEHGNMIDDFDIVIAGQAISEGLTVVTDNIKHFNRIPGLKIVNWLER
ncbi:MAG: type II toxin-antitoxin system VapC family toxin [Prevotella sp.]|nr:type II toxin-antitoxin system VapC family toxin [Prevotella sp.]